MDRRFLWGLAGLVSYVGAALALAMAVAPVFELGGLPEIAPTDETLGLLVVSALLFGLGGLCLRRAAARISPTTTTPPSSRAGSGGGQSTREADGAVARCGECGTENEAFYTFCEGCAERL